MERTNKLEFEYEGRTFVARKMSAYTAIGMLKEMLFKVMPFNIVEILDNESDGAVSKTLGKFKNTLDNHTKVEMTMEEFDKFQLKLLKYVSEILPSGEVPVLDRRNNFAVIDVEYNIYLVGLMLIKVLVVNYKDFFVEILQKSGTVELTEEMKNNLNKIMN